MVKQTLAVVLVHFLDFILKATTAESQDIHPQDTSIIIIETEKGILRVEPLPSMTENFTGVVKLWVYLKSQMLSAHLAIKPGHQIPGNVF